MASNQIPVCRPASPSPPPDARAFGRDIFTLDPLADRDWDHRIENLPGATIHHTAAWLRVLHQTFGFTPVAFCHGDRDRPTAILPVAEVASGVTGRRAVTLPLTDACGPLGADRSAFVALFGALCRHAEQRQWDHLQLRGGREFLPEVPPAESYHRHCLLLNLGERVLLARCDGTTRRALREAGASGLIVDCGHGPDMMDDFFQLHGRTWKRQGVPPLPYRFFEHVDQHLTDLGRGFIVLARYQGAPVAGAIVLHDQTKAVVQCTAWDDRFAHTHARHLVLHETVHWLAARGFTELDLGRTALRDNARRQFHLGWGAHEELLEYFHYDVRHDAFCRHESRLRSWPARVCRLLPLPMLRPVIRTLHRHFA